MQKVTFAGEFGTFRNRGYVDGRTAYEQGYVSRKSKLSDVTPVFKSGTGEYFYYVPNYNSTRFKIRQYIVKL